MDITVKTVLKKSLSSDSYKQVLFVSVAQEEKKKFAHCLFSHSSFYVFLVFLKFFSFHPSMLVSCSVSFIEKNYSTLYFSFFLASWSNWQRILWNSRILNLLVSQPPKFRWICILRYLLYLRNYWPLWTMTRFCWIFLPLDNWESSLLQRSLSTSGSPQEIQA